MKDVAATHGPSAPIYIANAAREDWMQQIVIPPTATVQTLVLLHSQNLILPSSWPSASAGRKDSLAEEVQSGGLLNKTMTVSHKVKKSGKRRPLLAMDRYISLLLCNGKTILSFLRFTFLAYHMPYMYLRTRANK
jgi:hypothetical protein